MSTQKKHLPNLDSLRGIAALLVVISHIEQIKSYQNIAHINNWGVIGSIGVTIFFLLGGFLSTYFLINEKLKNGNINFKLMYNKRYIRIWPLYLVVLITSFFIWPTHMEIQYFGMCIFMMSNVAFAMYALNPTMDQIWTLGAEDQYYLIHPQLFRIKSFKTIYYWFIGLFLLYIAIRYGSKWFLDYPRVNFFLAKTRFDNFLLGGIIAFMYYENEGKINIPKLIPLNLIYKKTTQVVFTIIILSYLIYCTYINNQPFSETILMILAIPVLINLAFNEHCIINIETKWLNFIGKISFSLYMSHKIIIYGVIVFMKQPQLYPIIAYGSFNHLILYPILAIFNIGGAWIIYNFFEKYILTLKEKMVAKNQT